jgi:hypothetical protein
MRPIAQRIVPIAVLCLVSTVIGGVSATFIRPADAAVSAAPVSVVAGTSVSGQAAYGAGGVYTVVPVMDEGAGYSWMAYAIAFAPDGKVTIISTHPKKADELGTIVKQFSIK